MTQESSTSAVSAEPSIVLIHGAWADASSWTPVISRLQGAGYDVIAPTNPLRGLHYDSAYVASILATLPGPLVVVGHSYGGAVITNAAAAQPQVKALVYVAAFIPDEGETVNALAAKFPGSQLVPPGIPGVPPTLIVRPTPNGADAYLDLAVFSQIFAADLPEEDARVMAATQRGTDVNILAELSGPAAWKSIPAWAVVALQDNTIGTANTRFMAERAAAGRVAEVESSHVVMVSHPDEVVAQILAAVESLERPLI